MGFFNFIKGPDMEQGLQQCRSNSASVLIDVRTRAEYTEGHIPGSKNIPLQEIQKIASAVPDHSTPIFVYCLSGARSRQAVSELRRMGYSQVTNLGGINSYHGKVEK